MAALPARLLGLLGQRIVFYTRTSTTFEVAWIGFGTNNGEGATKGFVYG